MILSRIDVEVAGEGVKSEADPPGMSRRGGGYMDPVDCSLIAIYRWITFLVQIALQRMGIHW
jgi:hypothetical protein